MMQAIIEIAGMLLIALGIGVFFTNRYWKSRYDQLNTEKEGLKTEVAGLGTEVESLGKEVSDLKTKYEKDIAELKSDIAKKAATQKKDADKRLSAKEAEVKKLTTEVKQLDAAHKKLETTTAEQEKSHTHSLELKDEELGEKEREIEALSVEFSKNEISYYKQIDGKRYKASTLVKADESVEGRGDGRISKADAIEIFATISDGHLYTQVEKDTMHYIRENYNWTPEADELFRTKVRSWAAKGHQME